MAKRRRPRRSHDAAPASATPRARPTAGEERARLKVRAADVDGELIEGQSKALLQELHLLTRRGDLNADARRKLKQINHYCNLLRPEITSLFGPEPGRDDAVAADDPASAPADESRVAPRDPVLLDAGAGNAYLGFILYEVFLQPRGRGHVVNVDRRADLIERGASRADRLAFERMHFHQREVAELLPGWRDARPEDLPWTPTGTVDAVISLHACDTATDEAILLGLQTQAEVIALVPCCQAEVFNLLKGQGKAHATHPLWRHAWHRREFGAHLTNVIRALVLEAHGYKVRVTELAGWEHSLKNELILARKHQRGNRQAQRQLAALLSELPPLAMGLLESLAPRAVEASATDPQPAAPPAGQGASPSPQS